MQNYHILERIGEGSFGKVYRGRRKYSGHVVALKFVSKRGKSEKNMSNLRQEINILRGLNHSNVIAMLDSFETEGEFCMVTEYAQGELFQILEDDHQLPEDEIKKIAVQLLQALHYLHTNRIIHRDMKPQNILVGPKQQIKLCDFGFARAISADTNVLTSIKGTPLYMAPELVKEQPYNHTVDLWSLGVILYELAVGRPPFYTDKIVTLIQLIVKENVKYPATMSAEFKSFLSGLLQKDPSKRMTWPDILNHPFARETALQIQDREALERQVRRLPTFYEANQKLANSALQRSVEWKPVDPQTGQVIDTPAVVSSTQKSHDELRTPSQAQDNSELVRVWSTYEIDTTGHDAGYLRLFDAPTFISHVNQALTCTDSVCLRTALYVVHRALQQVVKASNSLDARHLVIVQNLRASFLEHLPHVLSRSRDNALQMVRSLMLQVQGGGDCKADVGGILWLLRERQVVADVPLLSKVLKWLGTCLDHEANAAIVFQGIVHDKAELIPALCGLLDHEDTSVATYAVFALASLVHPNGAAWNIDIAFPATAAAMVDSLPVAQDKIQRLRSTYALRIKIHTDVSTALFKTGFSSLLAKVGSELDLRTHEVAVDDDNAPHTLLTNLLKVLFYSCRVSSPLSKRAVKTVQLFHAPTVLDRMNGPERYFALESMAVCQRRGVLSAEACVHQLFQVEMTRSRPLHVLDQSAMCTLLSETVEGDVSGGMAKAAVELVPLLSFALPSDDTTNDLLFCFGLRATGVLDSSVIALYRIVASLKKHGQADLLHQVLIHLEAYSHWPAFCTLLKTGGNDKLSPWGLFCLLKLIRVLTEHMTETDQFLPPHLERQRTLVPLLVSLLRPAHIQHLLVWPDEVGGGLQAVKAMVHAIVKIVSMPFMSADVSEELVFQTQELLYESGCVGLVLGILSQHALEMELLVKFLSRLVTSSPHFAMQFVDANGVALLKLQGLLQGTTASLLVQDALVLLSHIARSSRTHYGNIEAANILVELRDLLASTDATLRAKTCNCVGNLSRHSNHFYEHFVQPLPPTQSSIVDGLLQCVQDSDVLTRRYACFAIGNAAFHTDQLTRVLQPAIPHLVRHLHDHDVKTRSNAAAALGNLVRQSGTCCVDLVVHRAPYSLLECAFDETDLGTRRIALFSLGNLCEYELCRQSMTSTDALFAHSLEGLGDDSTDELVKKYIRRILSKWPVASGGGSRTAR
ncbi:ULK/FUSED protein kinase [Aphanomyces invadans]|uniref:non-specific serine/threonine protein kinase n=1 Tax=Aphanomyces invadans TaxID=157072 RepID=A0A024UW08_9STRA|nr:ULK/FUSED protein kinase [Aphanomyces invadans]ETW10117.1 ULK/FUSED protein kinase [Aphanomyces invadans]|eukprot:XP_008861528.1 ULK/FUSED protein kinase [Aphanomyces invadans]